MLSSSDRFTPGDVRRKIYILDMNEPPESPYKREAKVRFILARSHTQITYLIESQIAD
jgi:hypothetical protein